MSLFHRKEPKQAQASWVDLGEDEELAELIELERLEAAGLADDAPQEQSLPHDEA